MQHDEVTAQKFTTKQVSEILKGLGNFDVANLRDWHRRGILAADPVGRGKDRQYSFSEIVYIAVLAFLGPHMRYAGLFEASDLARQLAPHIEQLCAGTDAERENSLVYAMVYEFNGTAVLDQIERARKVGSVAAMYGLRSAVMVDPGAMAAELLGRAARAYVARKA